ncbi:hypothetical protein GCM10027055_04290 [Janibacter alkaliphilus]
MEEEAEAPEPVDEPLPEEPEPFDDVDELLELSDDEPVLDELSEDPPPELLESPEEALVAPLPSVRESLR